jgi:hypothetical protein
MAWMLLVRVGWIEAWGLTSHPLTHTINTLSLNVSPEVKVVEQDSTFKCINLWTGKELAELVD